MTATQLKPASADPLTVAGVPAAAFAVGQDGTAQIRWVTGQMQTQHGAAQSYAVLTARQGASPEPDVAVLSSECVWPDGDVTIMTAGEPWSYVAPGSAGRSPNVLLVDALSQLRADGDAGKPQVLGAFEAPFVQSTVSNPGYSNPPLIQPPTVQRVSTLGMGL